MDEVKINSLILKKTCAIRRMSQTDLAKAIGVHNNTVWQWIWDKHSPSRDNFYAICEALDISPKLLAMDSKQLAEVGRTERVLNFYLQEVLEENEPADYREVQLIEADLAATSERDAEEGETKDGKITVYGAGESSGTGESDSQECDDKQGEGTNS